MSDCLSRLESDGQTSFSEEDIRDVSGNMFAGKSLSKPYTHALFLMVWRSCSRDGMLRMRPGFPSLR